MAIDRKTRQFSDLDMLFDRHPLTNDVLKKYDIESIKFSLKNLISTRNYERPFHPEIGCQMFALLFENFTPITKQIMIKTIEDVIEKFEPRVNLIRVDMRDRPDENEIIVEIVFKIVGTERPVTFRTAITRVR